MGKTLPQLEFQATTYSSGPGMGSKSKGVPWAPQTFQATAETSSYSQTPDGKALLLKTQLPM